MLFTDAVPALTINWLEIGGILTFITSVLIIVWHNDKRFSKKVDKKTLNEYKSIMEKQIEQICADNSRSHGEIRADNDKYLNLVRDELKTDREHNAQLLDLILEAVRRIEKNGNGKK